MIVCNRRARLFNNCKGCKFDCQGFSDFLRNFAKEKGHHCPFVKEHDRITSDPEKTGMAQD